MDNIGKIEYLIIHHTERNFDAPPLVKIRHKYLRGWDSIGYHFLIDNGLLTSDGRLYSGRDERLEGAHALGFNKKSLGICIIGDFDSSHPTSKQMDSLISLLRRKIDQYEISPENVLGHNELPGVRKSCPGKLTDLNMIRSRL